MARRRKLTNEEISQIIGQEISAAEASGDNQAANREDAIDAYFMRPQGNEIPGRSQVVTGDISAMTDAVIAQTLAAFTSDTAIAFAAIGPGDESAAEVETDIVNQFVMQENDGYCQLSACLKDALLCRNGITKVWIQERTDSQTIEIPDLQPEALVELQQQFTTVDHTGGDRWRLTTTVQELKVEAVPPENFGYKANWNSIYLDECPFVYERKYITRSDLLEMGYNKKLVQDLPATTNDIHGDSTARNPGGYDEGRQAWEASQDLIEVYEVHIRIDLDQDGIGELRRIVTAGPLEGGTILANDPAPRVPYAAGAVFSMPHRFLGVSLYDKLAQVYRAKTAAVRQWLDNANVNNNPRAGLVEGQVNMEDWTQSRPGGAVRIRNPQAITPIPTQDIGPSQQALIQFLDAQRSELGGASLDLQSAEAQLVGSQVGSMGLDRAYSVKEQLAAMMCRTFGETLVRTLYQLVHETLRESWNEPVPYQRQGQWTKIDPSQWPERKHVNLKLGLSVSERRRKLEALGFVIQQQMSLIQAGQDGVLTNKQGLHNAMMDWCRAAELDAPEQYWVDPQSQEAQQAQQQMAQSAQQQQQAQAQMADRALSVEERKVMQAFMELDREIQFKYFDATLKAEIEESKLESAATNDLQQQQSAGRARAGTNGSGNAGNTGTA